MRIDINNTGSIKMKCYYYVGCILFGLFFGGNKAENNLSITDLMRESGDSPLELLRLLNRMNSKQQMSDSQQETTEIDIDITLLRRIHNTRNRSDEPIGAKNSLENFTFTSALHRRQKR